MEPVFLKWSETNTRGPSGGCVALPKLPGSGVGAGVGGLGQVSKLPGAAARSPTCH